MRPQRGRACRHSTAFAPRPPPMLGLSLGRPPRHHRSLDGSDRDGDRVGIAPADTDGATGSRRRVSDLVDVAIVGGGAAGIAAARWLSRSGRSVLLIEALPELGGRARTRRIAGLPLDLGCGWLHSAERNPLARLAETEGLPLDRSHAAWGRQLGDLGASRTSGTRPGKPTGPSASGSATPRLRAIAPATPWRRTTLGGPSSTRSAAS